jgi:hypothetical protein
MRLADIQGLTVARRLNPNRGLVFVSPSLFDILSGNRARLKRAKDKAGSNDTLAKNRKLVHQPIRFKPCRFVGSIPLTIPEGEDA